MQYTEYLSFLGKNALFSSVIIFVSFIVGWIIYSGIILRGISLKDSLFKKDNLAAWVEFIGAFIFPTLYLAAKSIENPTSDKLMEDFVSCLIYVLCYVVLFTILRLLSGLVVKVIAISDGEGKVGLNNEVYSQKNTSAALFSVALSIAFANIISFLNIDSGYFQVSIYRMLVILLFTVLAVVIYSVVLRTKTTLFKEIFVDNNPAAGLCFAGFMFAVQIILENITRLQVEFNLIELSIVSLISLILFGVLSFIFKHLLRAFVKVDVWKEIYEDNNVGAAIGQIALYIGIANVIVHFMK